MAWDVSDDPVDFDEAIEWFRGRHPITRAELAKLRGNAAARAFYVSNVSQLDLVVDVWAAIDKAVKGGTTLEDFKAEVGAKLEAAWGGTVDDPPWRLETIFRTNVQSAYGAGRYEQATHPDVLEDRPVWMFDAILDGRETEICRACDGTKLPASDPWWKARVPPLHFNCRSSVITLTKGEAGKITLVKPTAKPQQGFGAAPSVDSSELGSWAHAFVDAVPESLREVAREKMTGGPPRPAAPRIVAITQVHDFEPTGTPVSKALELGGGKAKKDLAEAIEVIDAVHGDGALDGIPIKQVGGKNQHGVFEYVKGDGPEKIAINSSAPFPRLSLLHEVGHFLDNQGIGTKGFNASEQGDVDDVMKAIRSTFAHRELSALSAKKFVLISRMGRRERFPLDPKRTQYLLRPQELFARAYARYVAVRSGKKSFVDELNRMHATLDVVIYKEQWEDDDFEPVAAALDRLFVKLGWLKSP